MAPTRSRLSARTPLLCALRRIVRLAALANRRNGPPAGELLEIARQQRMSRRHLLGAAAAGAAAAGLGRLAGPWPPRAGAASPRIVIVGAGMAGLSAAYRLRKAGHRAEIYEASSRTGGRVLSVRDAMAPGLVAEFGGEFIDSNHADMLALAKEFRFSLLDMEAPSESSLGTAYYFDGVHYTERQAIEELRPFAARVTSDRKRIPEDVGYGHRPAEAVVLDRMSLAEYLDAIGMRGWTKAMLSVAYVTEYGLDAGEMSSLNMITDLGIDHGLQLYGDSDERYKVRGGNQQLAGAMAERLRGQIHIGYRLAAVRPRGAGVVLTFERTGGASVDVPSDFAVLALPFTLLRDVAIGVPLPPLKAAAIRDLGYGMNTKVMFGVRRRVWRDLGYTGLMYSDLPFQTGWDNSQVQPGPEGGYTMFLGGTPAVRAARDPVPQVAERARAQVDRAFPGTAAAWNDKIARMPWPVHPWSRSSYSAFKVGQWTTLRGVAALPAGRLYFAGEHTSEEFRGFMNGAAETGRLAAEAILGVVGAAAPTAAGVRA